jgi:acetyl esterase/lipase
MSPPRSDNVSGNRIASEDTAPGGHLTRCEKDRPNPLTQRGFRLQAHGAQRIGLIGFSAGGHLAGLAALAPGAAPDETVQFAVLGYAITSMETETYRPARLILLGENASPQLRRSTSLDSLVTPQSPPFFIWHTAEDPYVPPEHTYRLASALAASHVPHAVHMFTHGPHSLGLAQGAGEAAIWTTLANARIHRCWVQSGC